MIYFFCIKMKKHYFILTMLLALGIHTFAQEIDNSAVYKSQSGRGYVRMGGDDDFLNSTDDQYTEGLNFEISTPGMKHFFLTSLLINPHYQLTSYGIGLEQADYTPQNLRFETVPANDRPYAGVLLFKTFLTAYDPEHKQTFSSTLYTGMIGPASLGANIQDAAHKMMGDVQPPGWQYQVQNDVAINYQVNYEKTIVDEDNLFLVDATIMGRVGTLSDKMSPGIRVSFGNTDVLHTQPDGAHKIHAYIYDAPQANFVAYDATLQGGMFDRSSPYTLPSSALTRATFMNRTGLVIGYGRCMMEVYHCFLTPQFLTDANHSWDGVQLTMVLKK